MEKQIQNDSMNLLVKVPGFGVNQDTRSIPSFGYLEIFRKHYSVAGSRDTMVSKTKYLPSQS